MDRKSLRGSTERRALPVSLTSEQTRNEIVLTGYASVFDSPYDVYGGAPHGWSEIVDQRAFEKTLRSNPDVHLLINHEGLPLARTKSGTLQLATDSRGLHVRAALNRSDPDVQRLEPKMLRGDMDQMSFAFRTIRDDWSGDESERRLIEVNIDHGDVSVVNFGANPATAAELNSLDAALEYLADFDLDHMTVAEVRGVDNGNVALALATLERISGVRTAAVPKFDGGRIAPQRSSTAHSHTLLAPIRVTGDVDSVVEQLVKLAERDESVDHTFDDGICSTCAAAEDDARADDPKKPYGDVPYADPGYQSDGKKRYPLDTEAHCKAAWSYINQSGNASKYSSEQLSAIKGRIKAAAKKFGIDISDESKSERYADPAVYQRALAKSRERVGSTTLSIEEAQALRDGIAS